MAYDRTFGSIEADIFLRNSGLMVAHDEKELKYNRSFRKIYLENIDSCLHKNGGYPYKDSSRYLQLLIDIKTDSVHLFKLSTSGFPIPSFKKNNFTFGE